VYAAAAAVAILDPRSAVQAFHLGHTHAVAALAVSPCGTFGASGDSRLQLVELTHVQRLEELPCVRVWDAGTGALLAAFPPCVTEGVAGSFCFALCARACCLHAAETYAMLHTVLFGVSNVNVFSM
jgi:hypothetical protein